MKGILAKAKAPLSKMNPGASVKPSTSTDTGTSNTGTKSPKVQDPPKATVLNRGTSHGNRLTGIAQRGVSRLSASAKNLAGQLSRLYAHTGRYAIKNLPTILKGVAVYSMIKSLYSLLDAINASLKMLAHGTPVPQFEKDLAKLTSTLKKANNAVTGIYEEHIMSEENIPALVDEMYNIGDKENLDKLTELLMEDYHKLSVFQSDLADSLEYTVLLQRDIVKSSEAHKDAYKDWFIIETASKGHALLMWDALSRIANSLTYPIKETQTAIDTLEALANDYNELADYANDASWTIQILRNRDTMGLEIYTTNMKPLESIWGPEATPE